MDDVGPLDRPAAPRPRWERLALPLILLLALAQALLFVRLTPPWQHYDEPTHFEYAWLLADLNRRPTVEEGDLRMRREVAASMAEHDFYWNLPRPLLVQDARPLSLGIPEMVHPPAYYWIASLPLRLTRFLDMRSQLYAARAISLLLFLLVVGSSAGIMRELLPTGHPLRWAVPLTVTLLAPFVNQMTAVNNDVGAVLIVSLFLWGSVRLIRRGLSLGGLLWVVGAGLLAVAIKTTAAIVLPFVPLVLLLALWGQLRWRWRWLVPLCALLVALVPMALLSGGDAAYWYRTDYNDPQPAPSRTLLDDGAYALTLQSVRDGSSPALLNPLSPSALAALDEPRVTVGGWLWAERPITVDGPGILLSEAGSTGRSVQTQPITLTQQATFVALTYELPAETGRLFYLFSGRSRSETPPTRLFLRDAFLVVGELPAGATPTLEGNNLRVGPQQLPNLLRNPTGTQAWPRVRPQLDQTLARYGRRSPTFSLAALLDVEVSAPYLLGHVLPHLVWEQFSAFGWGHVTLPRAVWGRVAWLLVGVALIGAGWWLLRRARHQPAPLNVALVLLLLVSLGVWLNALVWPLAFQAALPPNPAGRYVYPAIIPATLLLAGGWGALWPRRLRPVGWALFFALLLALNVAGVQRVATFYGTRTAVKQLVREPAPALKAVPGE